MPRCDICGKNVSLPFHCQYCGKNFCDEHLSPPNHACAGLAEWKNTPAPGVGIRYRAGRCYSVRGRICNGTAPGKKQGRLPGGGIPYLKIAVAVIVIIFIVPFSSWA